MNRIYLIKKRIDNGEVVEEITYPDLDTLKRKNETFGADAFEVLDRLNSREIDYEYSMYLKVGD